MPPVLFSNRRSITLRVATQPSTFFDGSDTVTFEAVDVMGSYATTSASTSPSSQGGHDDDGISNTAAAGGASNTASFDVTFFHCPAGSFWDRDPPGVIGSDEHAGICQPCSEKETDGETQVVVGRSDDGGAHDRTYDVGVRPSPAPAPFEGQATCG